MIRMENVCKIYPGSVTPVINDLNLHIEAGEICVLVGASGCGKTTTMRMINRMIDATSGKIYVNGEDIETLNPIELRRNIGYVIQETGLFPHYTIEKNIAVVPTEKKWSKKRIADRVMEMLQLVDLDPSVYAKKKPSALSGGQKQRVGVARALAGDPPIMLMDEPFGALDPITRSKLQNEFLKIQEKIKKTIVFVTHDMDEAIKMGDKIGVMQNGNFVQYGTPHEILTNPANEFVESLVGENRILKRFSLTRCQDFAFSAPIYPLSQGEAIVQALAVKDKYAFVGVTDEGGAPLGYIPVGSVGRDIPAMLIGHKTGVQGSKTLYDALGTIFGSGERCVFVINDDNKAQGLIGLEELFEAVNEDGKNQ